MPSSSIKRRVILGSTLLATVIASVWPRAEERAAPEVVAPVARDDRAASGKPAAAARAELPQLGEQLERPPVTAAVQDLFAATSWRDERKAAPPPPPPAPTAPPFPYAITGTLLDGHGPMVLFARANQDFVARAGDMLDENYRVEAIDAASVTIRYMPLKMTQVLPLGAFK